MVAADPMTADAGGDERVARGARAVGAGILVSRFAGLARGLLFARYFGDGMAADAYNAALRIPNTVRNLLGDGTISASFVPVYAAAMARGDHEGARALANALLGVLLAVVATMTLVGVAAAPWLTTIFAGGLAPETAALTTRLLRVLFPMTGVMVLSGWCLGVQNAHRRFFVAYAAAAGWALVQVVFLLIAGPRMADRVQLVWWLSWATLIGAVVQVLVQLPQVWRLLRVLRPSLATHTPGLGAVVANFVPVVGALGFAQISGLIDLRIASELPAGAMAVWNYAVPVYLLPLSLFGVAGAMAALPEFAAGTRDAADRQRISAGLVATWGRVLFYVVPSAIALIAVGDAVVTVLYRGGAFGDVQVRRVWIVLAGYAVGLTAFATVRLFASTFHALQDYRTPLRGAAIALPVSVCAAVALVWPVRDRVEGVAAIALGSGLGACVNVIFLARGLERQLGGVAWRVVMRRIQRILAASAAAVAVTLLARMGLPPVSPRVDSLALLVLFSVTFLPVAEWLGLDEARALRRRLMRRR
jgi:putative peptidoglycan lipid II flippase